MLGMALGTGVSGIKIAVVIQLAIGTIGTWGFVRRIGCTPAAATIAALAWASSAPAQMLVGWFSVTGQMAAWIPLLLLSIESAWQARRWSARLGWAALGGIAVIQMFLSWPQGFLYGGMLMAGWLGYRVFIEPAPDTRPLRDRLITAIGIGAGMIVIGCLTGLGGILPRLEFIAASSIPGGDYSNVIDGNYSEEFARWVGPFAAILTGTPYWRSMTLSPVILLIVAIGLIARPWRPGTGFLLVAALVCFDLAVFPSLTRWAFDLFPPFAHIHDHRPVVTMYLVPVLLVILAGIGADAFQRQLPSPRWLVVIAAGITVAILFIPPLQPNLTFVWWQVAVLAAATVVVLGVRHRAIAMPIRACPPLAVRHRPRRNHPRPLPHARLGVLRLPVRRSPTRDRHDGAHHRPRYRGRYPPERLRGTVPLRLVHRDRLERHVRQRLRDAQSPRRHRLPRQRSVHLPRSGGHFRLQPRPSPALRRVHGSPER
jgi:hypothetical protein